MGGRCDAQRLGDGGVIGPFAASPQKKVAGLAVVPLSQQGDSPQQFDLGNGLIRSFRQGRQGLFGRGEIADAHCGIAEAGELVMRKSDGDGRGPVIGDSEIVPAGL